MWLFFISVRKFRSHFHSWGFEFQENILPAGLHLDSSVPNLNPIEKSM